MDLYIRSVRYIWSAKSIAICRAKGMKMPADCSTGIMLELLWCQWWPPLPSISLASVYATLACMIKCDARFIELMAPARLPETSTL